MLGLLETIGQTTVATLRDVTPIVTILFGFQWLVLRRRPPNLKRIATGFVYVLLGLTLFLVGLEEALFPLGETMAQQLAAHRRLRYFFCQFGDRRRGQVRVLLHPIDPLRWFRSQTHFWGASPTSLLRV